MRPGALRLRSTIPPKVIYSFPDSFNLVIHPPAMADRGPYVDNVNYVFLILATVAVALRFYGRYIAHKAGYWWDDWLSLAALVSSLCYPTCYMFIWGILILDLVAVCVVHSRTFAILGIHRTWETYRRDPRITSFAISIGPLRGQRSLQHWTHCGQDVGSSFLHPLISIRPSIPNRILVDRDRDRRMGYRYQFSGYFYLRPSS